jgi:SAM-dependent methyltransferase
MEEGVTTGDPFAYSAATYDAEFSSFPRVRALRERVLARLAQFAPPPRSVLEIGCGTGEDAILMRRAGYTVLATDPSEPMLALARAKAARSGDEVEFARCGAEEIASLGGRRFGAAFSNFGALNCVEDLGTFFANLAPLLGQGDHALLVFLNRYALWESAGHLVRGRIGAARRRWRASPVDVRLKGQVCPTWYQTPRSVARSAGEHFRVAFMEGLNVCSPPPASAGLTLRFSRLVGRLDRTDALLGPHRPFSRWGDHLLIVLRRRGEGE